MTPAARRATVTVARDAHGISERWACSIIGADAVPSVIAIGEQMTPRHGSA